MSKLFVMVLLAALLLPVSVLADPAAAPGNCCMVNATGGAYGWGPGMMAGYGPNAGYCPNGSGCVCDADGSCGPGWQGYAGDTNYRGMMGQGLGSDDYRYGMMGGWGQTPGMMAGMYGVAAVGFILVILLIIIWIIVGILLILHLYRKLSVK